MTQPEIFHEIKNPLALINANIDLLSLEDKDDIHKKSYGVIKNALRRINAVIDRNASERNKMERVNICSLVKDITGEYGIISENKRITFDMAYSSENITIDLDRIKAEILFYNIYKNAIEAIDEKGTVSTHITETEYETIIDVIDDGRGIDPSVADKIGMPFVTTKEEGSGLGISICRSIAKESGGCFEIMNVDSGGCLVRVTFPKMDMQ